MSKLIAYKVGPLLEMRPATSKRPWMDVSSSKNAYRCLPLSMANGYGWEFVNPSDFLVEWDGNPSPKSVKIIQSSGTIFPDNHFGEGTFTWHTGYLFKTEYPYGLYATGAPNNPKPLVIPLSGIIETHWLPFTFTMNWRFTEPGSVEFKKGEVICQIFPVDMSIWENMEPEVRHLSEDPEFEEKYWQWNVSRAAFGGDTTRGNTWQKDYFQGKYANLNVETACPFHVKRTAEEEESNPHLSKNNVPEFKVVDDRPYYTPTKYMDILKHVREVNQKKAEDARNKLKPVTTETVMNVTKENTLPDIAEKINNAEKLILLLVVSNECNGTKTQLELDLETRLQSQNVELVLMCIPDTQMPFPKVQTDMLYYFAPKNQTPLFYRERYQILTDLEHDIASAHKMMAENVTYYEAKFDEKTKDAILKTEEIIKEDTSKFPSALTMARGLAKELWKSGKNAAKGLPIMVSAEVGLTRLSTCETCEKLEKDSYRCQECGCFMKVKTQLAASSCPIGKWVAVS